MFVGTKSVNPGCSQECAQEKRWLSIAFEKGGLRLSICKAQSMYFLLPLRPARLGQNGMQAQNSSATDEEKGNIMKLEGEHWARGPFETVFITQNKSTTD